MANNMADKLLKGLGVAVGAGFACLGMNQPRQRAARKDVSPSDGAALPKALLDRLDRIDACVRSLEAQIAPLPLSIAELDLRIQQHAKNIEVLQAQVNETKQEEADRDIARLATLLTEMKHPLMAAHAVH